MEEYVIRLFEDKIEWYKNDELCTIYKSNRLHKLDGPAVEYYDGEQHWYKDGELHREDGPAISHLNGSKEWWFKGKLHRTDGPAVEYYDGEKEWWFEGKQYTEEEFLKINVKELTVEEISKLLGFEVKVVKG